MSELKEISKFQRKFDRKHFPEFWNLKTDEDFLHRLQYMTVALAGEMGEFANVVKKITRDFETLKIKPKEKSIEKLKEELTDCFIYTLIISNLLEMDLEKEYFRKMGFNKKRFTKKYKRS